MSKLDELLTIEEIEQFLKETQNICKKKLSALAYLNEYDKEDAIQVTLIKVYKAIDKYDKQKAMASTYFDRVITNGIKSYLRYTKNFGNNILNNSLQLVDCFEDGTGNGENNSSKIALSGDNTIFNTVDIMVDFMENCGLDEREKKIIYLRYDGFNFQDIAEIIGCTKARISQLWKGIMNKDKTRQELV